MNKSYLSSVSTIIVSLKPSRSIRLLLMVLFVCLFGNTVIGQSVGDYRSNGNVTFTASTNWQKWNGSSWITATLAPTSLSSANTITVLSPNTASVSGTVALSASLAVSGAVNLANNTVFTLGSNSNWSNITINSGGLFNMPNSPGSASATLILYGNYYNNGTTDFWKSIVVITGDLLSPSTSALQNQGNVIVGGNIIGDFDLTGGSGGSQIYPVNPNATVTITPSSIDNNVSPGTFPSSEASALISLVNTVILGNNTCSFTITDPSSNISACVGGNISTTITSNASSPSYQWQINSGSGWSDISGQTSATLSLTSVISGMSGNKYRVKVTSSSCTKNGNYVTLTVNALPTITTESTPAVVTAICQSSSVQTTTMAYLATSGTPTSYSIDWATLADQGSTAFAFTAGAGSVTGITVPAWTSVGTYSGTMTITNANGCTATKTITLTVNAAPVGGGVYSGNTPICINGSTGNMTLGGGYVGNIVRWEKRLLPSTTWTSITNTSIIYSESPSVAGTWEYRAVVGNSSCAEVFSSAFSVTVNPELTIALTNSNVTVCQSTTTASFTYSATTGNPAGWVIDFDAAANTAGMSDQNNGLGGASGTITVNVPWGIAVGVYNGSLTVITYWPSCSSVSYPITVTVGMTAPISGTITYPNCTTATGSVVLSGLPASGTINQTGTVLETYTITGATMTISGLAAGTYNFSASNGTCNSSASENVVINAVVTNTWNGASWSNGTPNSAQKLVFSGDYPPAVDPNVDITGCSCMVTGGAVVTIKSGKTLTITNEVTVVGGGILTFENNASLVQINNVENSGNIIYKRTTSSVLTSDYTYWSSPVANHTLDISPSYVSGMFYSYNDFAVPEDWKGETAASEMVIGKGYIIRGPEIASPPPPPGLYNATFVGVPNNGTKTIAIGSTGTSNLLGNPYPSAINADAFLATNSTLIEGTIYFWTHNTAIQLASGIASGKAGSGVYAYTSDDYASYNVTGGVGTGTGNFENGVEETLNKPTGKIAAGQAFFTTSLGAGTVTFNNDMRLSSGGATLDNSQFFKTKNPKNKTVNAIEKNRVWLNMTNTKGAFKQILVGYLTDATNDYDSRFDGESFDANEFVDFYSINQDKNLVIQGRALPFDGKDEVPLGFRSAIDGAFTINIDEVDGLLVNQSVFLEDKLINTVTDLKSGNYTFNTTAGTFNERFVLRYTSKTLGTGDFDAVIGQVVISVKSKLIKINSFADTIDKVLIYDMSGRLICQKDKVNNSELLLTDIVSSHQTLIVKTRLQNGKIVTDKIIY